MNTLNALVQSSTAANPEAPLLWVSRSQGTLPTRRVKLASPSARLPRRAELCHQHETTRWITRLFRLKPSRQCCRRRPVGSAVHEANDPGDVIDGDLRLASLQVETRLRCLQETLRLTLIHDPTTTLLLPLGTWTHLPTKLDQRLIPGKLDARQTVPVPAKVKPQRQGTLPQ